MKLEVEPSQDPSKLLENLRSRFRKVERRDGRIQVEIDGKEQNIQRVPGVENYTVKGERKEGLGGRPIQEMAFFEIDSERSAAVALAATLDGYNLVVRTERKWDLKCLRRFNPDIKNLKSGDPEELGIKKLEKTDFRFPDSDDKIDELYRLLQP